MERRLRQLRQLLEGDGMAALLVAVPENTCYLSGFTGGEGMLLVTKSEQYIFIDGRYEVQVLEEAPDWNQVVFQGALIPELAAICLELQLSELGFEADYLTYQQYQQLQELLPGVTLLPSRSLVEQLRLVKQQGEVDLIREAGVITCASFYSILGELAIGQSEQEIAGRIVSNMRRFGGGPPAFETIVAGGERGALPHGLASDRKLQRGDLIVFDLGATYHGYAADLTRTIALGECCNRQREVYEAVLEAQKLALDVIRAGVTAGEVDAAARDYLDEAGFNHNFPHALGHGVGLNVHEAPRLGHGVQLVLEAGMVVTVEPGVYLSGWGGVRIEDTVLVTAHGCEILTPLAKDLIVI